jgi:preprotein translocase subunit SecY
MANEKYLTESIKYYTEIFRLVWLSILAVGGGSIGLLLGESTGVRLIFAIVGLMVAGYFLIFYGDSINKLVGISRN